MDSISLPLVTSDMTLVDVFERMSESGEHAAIVVARGRHPVLVTNREVDDALENGLERVSQLQGEPLHVPASEPRDWERALEEADKRFGVVWNAIGTGTGAGAAIGNASDALGDDGMEVINNPRSGSRTITVITRSERFAAELRGAGQVCRCRNNHRAPGGKPCRVCGSAVRCA